MCTYMYAHVYTYYVCGVTPANVHTYIHTYVCFYCAYRYVCMCVYVHFLVVSLQVMNFYFNLIAQRSQQKVSVATYNPPCVTHHYYNTHAYVCSAYKYTLMHRYTLYDICTGPEKVAAFWSLVCTHV